MIAARCFVRLQYTGKCSKRRKKNAIPFIMLHVLNVVIDIEKNSLFWIKSVKYFSGNKKDNDFLILFSIMFSTFDFYSKFD